MRFAGGSGSGEDAVQEALGGLKRAPCGHRARVSPVKRGTDSATVSIAATSASSVRATTTERS